MALSYCEIKTDEQRRELVNHGTGFFPIACYEDDLKKQDVPWHWHDELEAIVVSEGSAVIAVGNEKKVIQKGEGFFVNAGILHGLWCTGEAESLLHSVVFHPRLIGGNMDSVFWQSYMQPMLANDLLNCVHLDGAEEWHQSAINNIEQAWESCKQEDFGYELNVRNSLSLLVCGLSKYHPSSVEHLSEKEIRDSQRIKLMLQYMQEHCAEPLSIAQIARQAMISESECIRCFRATIDSSPIQYLKQYRIQKAAELLRATDEKIADIGTLCGFMDTSYFTKTFREHKGCTPSRYRSTKRLQRVG